MSKINTVHQTYLALKAEGIPISENFLRGLIAAGQIPALHSGRRAYIMLESVKEYLNHHLSLPQAKKPVSN